MKRFLNGSPMAMFGCMLALLFSMPAIGANMGGGMGGSSQGYITAPPTPNATPVRLQPSPEVTGKQDKPPDKCKTCANCLTESCRSMCWQRYCRK
ncbi:hypothetical protein O4G98_14230 [Zoogloeaceae bacterium G21618-S1]|nr:hypothetical protein [Zoogloeaceae bacterium G21618-S1]